MATTTKQQQGRCRLTAAFSSFPSFSEFITHFRNLPENQEPIDIAAAVAASPFMSWEAGRAG